MNHPSSSTIPFTVKGIPISCWCGHGIVTHVSKSIRNPYRRFYRCSYAVNEQLVSDNHVFKWLDDAFVDEIERVQSQIDRVENEVMEKLETTLMDLAENFIMEKVEYLIMEKVEKLVKEKVEGVVKEQIEQLLMDKIDNLVMEKVHEELMCMKLK